MAQTQTGDDSPLDNLSLTWGKANQVEYRSYLLRVWRGGADGGWRASLQSIPTGERHMFADLESLLAFLCD
jgi:hypothetical protein